MKALIFLFGLLFLSLSYGNVLEAPEIGFDYEQNPSHIDWKHISTDHFDIIFPKELENQAQRVAHLLEKAYPFVARSLEVKPVKIALILQNQSTNSNGFVTLAPRRSEWFVTPSIDPELTNTEWLKTLAIHEFRHVVQFQKSRRGFNKFLEIILGEIGQAVGLGLTLPPWFLEGDAVGIETALTKGGRGRLPLFDRDLRTLLLSGKEWDYDKAHLGSYEDYVPSHYVYGYFYTSWLRNEYGDLFLSKLANQSAETSWNPLSFYNSTENLTGRRFEKFYKEVMADLLTQWKLKAEKFTPTPYQVKNLGKRFGWTNYFYPQATGDGKILALKKGLSFISQFVLIDGKKESTLFYPSGLPNEYPYKLRKERFAFFEAEVDPRWGNRDYSRLKVFDIQKNKFILDKSELKGRLAVLDHDGERTLYVEWTPSQEQSLVILNMSGNEVMRIPYPNEKVITSIDWLSDTEVVFVTRDFDDMKNIVKFNLENQSEEILLEKTVTNIGFLTVEGGEVLFESPESGIDNIWLLRESGSKQLTSSLFGAYAPAFYKNKLLYNDYSVEGMNAVIKSETWDVEQKSEDSFYPIYEKFSQTENLASLESELLKSETYTSSDYSQFKNSINLHSWVLLAPPLSSSLMVIGYSKDLLNKFTLGTGAQYNLNEQTLEGFVSATWTHLYPVFDLRAGYGNRRQDIRLGGNEIENKWEEGTLEAGVQVPWTYLQGRFIHSFSSRLFSRLIKVTNKLTNDVSELSDGVLYSPGIEFSYEVSARKARRDLNPPLGLTLYARAEEGSDITGDDQKGAHQVAEGKLFLPGLWYHHSFYHQLAYERQRDQFYQYSALTLYPRGTRSLFLEEFHKYSGNYLMPLFYPDWNLSRYVYFKRISFNLFYDELNGRIGSIGYKAASTGWEMIFDMNFVRIFVPFSIGVRGSYIINGLEKSSNYEIFLASVLGTF